MSRIETYFLLFTDSFVSNLAISLNKEVMLYAAKDFATTKQSILIFITVVANAAAICVNYLLGRALFNIFNLVQKNVKQEQILARFKKFKNLLLVLALVPDVSKLIPVIAGLANYSFYVTFAICTVARCCYYSYVILT